MAKNEPADADASASATELRRKAEARLARQRAHPPHDTDAVRLLNELQVHQVELEIQNEELRGVRHEVEAALASYTQIFDFGPIGYLLLDSGGRILRLNLAGAQILGAERQRLVGRQLGSFVTGAGRVAFTEFLSRVISSSPSGSASCEVPLDGPGRGAHKEARLSATLLEGPQPEALVAIEDVTARKAAEAALRDENRNKDQFLAVLTGELRHSLRPIVESLRNLEKAREESELVREAHTDIDRQVRHLTSLVDEFLSVGRIAPEPPAR